MKKKSKFKIIFAGPVGSGKTTAIASISDKPPISTNESASDMTAIRKKETTVAMDYGVMNLENGDILHLYGTPGQQRFDFMWEILAEGGLGLVLLVDNRRENPFGDLAFYLKSFNKFINETGVVIGVTGMDVKTTPTLDQYQDELDRLNSDTHTRIVQAGVPIFEVDARKKHDISVMLEALLYSISTKQDKTA